MAQMKNQFYKEDDFNKKADISIDLRRPKEDEINKWTESQKLKAYKYIQSCRVMFDAFAETISNILLS